MRRRNITFVCNSLNMGGSQVALIQLVRLAAAIGFRVRIASRGGPLAQVMRESGATVVPLVTRQGVALNFDHSVRDLARTVSSFTAPVELALLALRYRGIVQASQPWPVAFAAAAAALTSSPFVWHVHGTTPVEMPPAMLGLVRRASRLWAVISPEVAHAVQRLDPPVTTDVRVLRTPMAKPDPATLANNPERGVVGIMSTLTANKAAYVRTCLEAMRELAVDRDMTLLVVGGGPSMAALEQYARSIVAATPRLNVRFMGPASDPWPLLAQCDVIAAMGLVAIEAAMRGHKVVCVGSEAIGGPLTVSTHDALFQTNFTGRGAAPLEAAQLALHIARAMESDPEPGLSVMLRDLYCADAPNQWKQAWLAL